MAGKSHGSLAHSLSRLSFHIGSSPCPEHACAEYCFYKYFHHTKLKSTGPFNSHAAHVAQKRSQTITNASAHSAPKRRKYPTSGAVPRNTLQRAASRTSADGCFYHFHVCQTCAALKLSRAKNIKEPIWRTAGFLGQKTAQHVHPRSYFFQQMLAAKPRGRAQAPLPKQGAHPPKSSVPCLFTFLVAVSHGILVNAIKLALHPVHKKKAGVQAREASVKSLASINAQPPRLAPGSALQSTTKQAQATEAPRPRPMSSTGHARGLESHGYGAVVQQTQLKCTYFPCKAAT